MSDDNEELIRVTVWSEALYGEEKTLQEWIKWLNSLFDQVVPEKYRGAAILSIDNETGYGDYHVEARLYYYRPMTDEERAGVHRLNQFRIEEAERLAAHWTATAARLRESQK